MGVLPREYVTTFIELPFVGCPQYDTARRLRHLVLAGVPYQRVVSRLRATRLVRVLFALNKPPTRHNSLLQELWHSLQALNSRSSAPFPAHVSFAVRGQ